MRSEKMRTWIIITGILAATFLAVAIVTTVSFFRDVTQPRVELESGSLVHIEEAQTLQIFLEDSAPPTLDSHAFTFINTENQNRIYSHAPTVVRTYSINSVVINGVPVSGTFGRLVALVDLEAGSYIIEFAPWGGSGIFVRGIHWTIAELVISVLAFFAFGALLIIFIVLLAKRGSLKRAEASAAAYGSASRHNW